MGFEIAEQLGWRLPRHVVVPTAGGTILPKVAKAFRELRDLGLVEGDFRIYSAQAAGCAPVVQAMHRGTDLITPVKPQTIAKSIAIGNPADGFYVLLRGQLDCYREVDSEQVPILIVGVGEQIGYVSMIGLFERLGDGKAHGPTVLLHIGSDLFYQLHLEYPFDFGILMLNLSREMARAFRRVTEELIDTSVSHSVI